MVVVRRENKGWREETAVEEKGRGRGDGRGRRERQEGGSEGRGRKEGQEGEAGGRGRREGQEGGAEGRSRKMQRKTENSHFHWCSLSMGPKYVATLRLYTCSTSSHTTEHPPELAKKQTQQRNNVKLD